MLAAVLGPAAFGAWTLFRLAGRYLGLAELGIRSGLEFEVAKRGEREAVRFRRAGIGFLGLVFGPIGILALVASFLVTDPLTVLALRVLALTLLAEACAASPSWRRRAPRFTWRSPPCWRSAGG